MHDWVDTFYPGLKIGITEYNWGAENHMNGATAQADVLGIFGREGLDLATRWISPGSNTPVGNAFKMYRNYDGNLSAFGDLSVRAIVPNPDNVSSFAALRTADNSLTIMVINKYLSGNTPATLNFSNFNSIGVAKVWQLANNTISHLADINFSGSSFSASLPPQSITLFVLPSSAPGSLLLDEFDDDVQSWPAKKGTWVESNGILSGSGPKSAIVYAPQPWFPSGVSGCSTCTLETDVSTAGGIGNKIFIQPWYQDKQNRVDVLLKQESGKIILKQKVNGSIAQKMKASFTIVPNTFHHFKVGFDGTNFHLEVDGTSLITMPAAAMPSGNLYFQVKQTTVSIEGVNIY
jgi:hypothetical protein